MTEGSRWNIKTAFQQEHRIAARFMHHPDFVEGVSARLIRKPPETPQWQPAELSGVSQADVDSFFNENPQSPASLTMLRPNPLRSEYTEYSHSFTALPKERAIADYIEYLTRSKKPVTRDAIHQHYWSHTGGKAGVREIVDDILQRRTEQAGDQLEWRPENQSQQED